MTGIKARLTEAADKKETRGMQKPQLSPMQKRRLVSASQEVLAKIRSVHIAQITDAPQEKIDELTTDVQKYEARFQRLLHARGFCVGDRVYAVVSKYVNRVEMFIMSIDTDGTRFETRLPDGRIFTPLSHEVVMFAPTKASERGSRGQAP